MKKIFDPGIIELADSRGDPNQSIAVQKKIGEMIQTPNLQRKEGLRRDIEELGPVAMPGLINSTWVWMKELKKNQNIRQEILELMIGFIDQNSAAADLLLRFGVLDAPFEFPRELARDALVNSQWKPTPEQAQIINKSLKLPSIAVDYPAIIDRLVLLAKSGLDEYLEIGTLHFKKWIAEFHSKEAGKLCAELLKSYPKQSQQILKDMFNAMTDAHSTGYKDGTIAENLINAILPIPCTWLLDGMVLQLSQEMLNNTARKTFRHTGLEYLWRDALKDLKKADQANWKNNFIHIGRQFQEKGKKMDDNVVRSLYRYWFRAIGGTEEINYIYEQACEEDENWGLMATVELFFSQKDKHAKQNLFKMQQSHPERFQLAESLYNDIFNKQKTDTDDIKFNRPAGLKK